MITYEDIKKDPTIRTYIAKADESLLALGYTEHSFAHVTHVAEMAGYIMECMGQPPRQVELAKIAAYLHDIGNLINRVDHGQSGAVMAFRILGEMGFEPEEIATIATAIGNHDEGTGVPVNQVAAALILADKSDVRRSRVQEPDPHEYDIHDRVNFSVTDTELIIDRAAESICLELRIDTALSGVSDYFEIFLDRMRLCRRAAETLGLAFRLRINGQLLM